MGGGAFPTHKSCCSLPGDLAASAGTHPRPAAQGQGSARAGLGHNDSGHPNLLNRSKKQGDGSQQHGGGRKHCRERRLWGAGWCATGSVQGRRVHEREGVPNPGTSPGCLRDCVPAAKFRPSNSPRSHPQTQLPPSESLGDDMWDLTVIQEQLLFWGSKNPLGAQCFLSTH